MVALSISHIEMMQPFLHAQLSHLIAATVPIHKGSATCSQPNSKKSKDAR
jgi:hypothetical protein